MTTGRWCTPHSSFDSFMIRLSIRTTGRRSTKNRSTVELHFRYSGWSRWSPCRLKRTRPFHHLCSSSSTSSRKVLDVSFFLRLRLNVNTAESVRRVAARHPLKTVHPVNWLWAEWEAKATKFSPRAWAIPPGFAYTNSAIPESILTAFGSYRWRGTSWNDRMTISSVSVSFYLPGTRRCSSAHKKLQKVKFKFILPFDQKYWKKNNKKVPSSGRYVRTKAKSIFPC